jgi:hypothetical protein
LAFNVSSRRAEKIGGHRIILNFRYSELIGFRTPHASFTFSVKGPKGTGKVDLYETMKNGVWFDHGALAQAEGPYFNRSRRA